MLKYRTLFNSIYFQVIFHHSFLSITFWIFIYFIFSLKIKKHLEVLKYTLTLLRRGPSTIHTLTDLWLVHLFYLQCAVRLQYSCLLFCSACSVTQLSCTIISLVPRLGVGGGAWLNNCHMLCLPASPDNPLPHSSPAAEHLISV